jgi:outer membrane receptor protein involved in Fe transport
VESIGAKGFELQTAYQVVKGLTVNANASYNLAKYETDWLVALPPQSDAELVTPLYINAKGQQLASVPKIGLAYGATWHKSFGAYAANISLANRFFGKKYSQDYHTADTFRKSYTLTNLVVGFGAEEGDWQLSVRATNLFDTKYGSYGTWGATSAATATPGAPRNFQIVFSSRL